MAETRTAEQQMEDKIRDAYIDYARDTSKPRVGWSTGAVEGNSDHVTYDEQNNELKTIRDRARLAAAEQIVFSSNPENDNAAQKAYDVYFGKNKTKALPQTAADLKAMTPEERATYDLACATAEAVDDVAERLDKRSMVNGPYDFAKVDVNQYKNSPYSESPSENYKYIAALAAVDKEPKLSAEAKQRYGLTDPVEAAPAPATPTAPEVPVANADTPAPVAEAQPAPTPAPEKVEGDGLVQYAMAGGREKGKQHNLWVGCETVDTKYEDDVIAYQTALASVGLYPEEKIEGRYGSNTKQATVDLQKKYGIKPDGIAGIDTMVALKVEEMTVLVAKARSGETLSAEEQRRLTAARQDIEYAVAAGYDMPPTMETQYAAVNEIATTQVAKAEPAAEQPAPAPATAGTSTDTKPIDQVQLEPADGSVVTPGGYVVAALDISGPAQAYAAAKDAVGDKNYQVAEAGYDAKTPGGRSGANVDSIDNELKGR